MLETAVEERARTDSNFARRAAMQAASLVGVPAEVLESLRDTRGQSALSARDWLQLALDAAREWCGDERAA